MGVSLSKLKGLYVRQLHVAVRVGAERGNCPLGCMDWAKVNCWNAEWYKLLVVMVLIAQ